MGEKRRLALLILLLLSSCAWAANQPGWFAISQLSVQPPVVNVYLDVLDDNGEPPLRLAASALSAKIQGEAVPVAQVTSFSASGEGVAYVFLVDISRSIGPSQFAQIQQAINNWIDGLKSADRMAIFTFGEQYKQVAGFTDEKARLKNAVQNLKPTDRKTKLYLALSTAVNLVRGTGEGLPTRRVIVILSDGKDEGSGITAEDVRDLIHQSHVPIYAIGSSRLPPSEREKYLQVLNRFATLSGGIYTEAASVQPAYDEIQNAIRRLFVVKLACDGCRPDNQPHLLEMTLTSGKIARTASLSVNLIAPPAKPAAQPPEQPKFSWDQLLTWKILLPLILVMAVILIVVFRSWFGGQPASHKVERADVIQRSETAIRPEPTPPPPAGRRIQLTVIAGKERGREDFLNLAGKSVIGRDSGCDASFPDDTEMSGRHCELSLAGKYLEIQDLGSTNGTLLNGAQLVTRQRLEDGDLVRAGRTEFRINFGGET